MVDMFILLQLPNAGDDLQAIKKGIVEIADLVAINKSDINPQMSAIACAQWKQAIQMLRPTSPNWRPPVITLSALQKQGIDDFWSEIEKFREIMAKTGELEEKRKKQALAWMWSMIEGGLRQRFRNHPQVHAALPKLSGEVASGQITPGVAARTLLDYLDQR